MSGLSKKARGNLSAARQLINEKLTDPAMSRLYYSMFQAGIVCLERLGKTPNDFDSRTQKWTHATICGNASLLETTPSKKLGPLFQRARSLRERADYDPQPVNPIQVTDILNEAMPFIERVCS